MMTRRSLLAPLYSDPILVMQSLIVSAPSTLDKFFQRVGWWSSVKVSSTSRRGIIANSHRNVTMAVSGPVYLGRGGASRIAREVEDPDMMQAIESMRVL